MLYGATGYTGGLVLDELLRRGIRPVLGGRNAGKLQTLAETHGLSHRTTSLRSDELSAAVRGIRVLLNAAGPFEETAAPLAAACLSSSVHYLDLSGEPAAIEPLARHHAAACERGVMIMPGIGFDVVASDCLMAHLARRVPTAQRAWIGLAGLNHASRGSARTFARWGGRGILIRRNGLLQTMPPGELHRSFDYGEGPRVSLGLTWGDVSTTYFTTGIPNTEVYFEATGVLLGTLAASRFWGSWLNTPSVQSMLDAQVELLPAGPTSVEREAMQIITVAEVEDRSGRRSSARLRTPQSYTFTALSSAEIAMRALGGDLQPGFQTPGRILGGDFPLTLPGVHREDLS